MPTTKYYRPRTLVNRTILNTTTNQNSIDWNYNGSISENNYAVTQQPLHTISGLWMERFLTNTSQLLCVNLGIPNPTTYTAYVPQVGYSYTYATGHNGITTGPTTSTTMQVDLGWDKILTLFTPDASTSNWSISDSGQLDGGFIPLSQLNYSLTTGSLSTNTFYVIIANNTVQGTCRNGLVYLTANIQNALPSFDVSSGTTLYFYNVQISLGFRHFPTIASQIVWADSSISVIGSGYMGSYYYPGDTTGNVNLTMVSTTVNSKAFPIAIQTTNYAPAVPSTVAYVPTILGVEFNLAMERYTRVEDLLIQLTLGGVLIGENKASTINPVPADIYTGDDYGVIMDPPGNNYTYGSSTDLWGTSGLTAANVSDPTFGIVVSFKSNPAFPHRDLAYLYQLGIRITYA
jgi:hypothetical protein